MASMTQAPTRTDLAVHPGEYLVEELDAREISQRELARRMERPLKTVSAIARGTKSVTAETALDLERVLEGIPAEFWVNLQSRYDLTVARQQAAEAPSTETLTVGRRLSDVMDTLRDEVRRVDKGRTEAMAAKRDHARYQFKRPDGTIIRSGITKRDTSLREGELKRKFNKRGTIHQVGPRVTEQSARDWERRQRKGTPPGGR